MHNGTTWELVRKAWLYNQKSCNQTWIPNAHIYRHLKEYKMHNKGNALNETFDNATTGTLKT